MIALAGAHRSGKTTLARALAADLGMEFLETKVSDVFADLGLDPKADMPFDQRLDVQNAILRSLEIQYQLRAGKVFIADRSPFDVLGYTMADIKRDTLDDALRDRVWAHVSAAMTIVAQNLRGVMLLPPLPDPVDAAGKAQACSFYMHHVYVCIQDMLESVGPGIEDFIAVATTHIDHTARMAEGRDFATMIRDAFQPEVKIWTPGS